ncbi:hypothetical protein F5X99DRAFT_372746 [Biscogniauxia marginata]|nr:hypothetical protein F5X99DRAFT_372746 [Biscogniauxia marginata]
MEPHMTPIVRKYSLQLDETMSNDILSQSLSHVAAKEEEDDKKKQVEVQEWQNWLRFDMPPSDFDSKRLDDQCKVVADTWKRFNSLFLDDEESKQISGLSVPTLDKLIAAVNAASKSWKSDKETKLGRFKERFISFINTMDDYSYLFSVIPSNDKYTSLITGVLSSIAKASANHKTTAEKFSSALGNIIDEMRLVHKHTKVANTPEIRQLVIEFYISVFEFLCFAMSWYKSKKRRVMGAINKNFNEDEVDSKVNAIQDVLKKLSREANLVAQGRIQDIHKDVRYIRVYIRDVFEEICAKLEPLKAVGIISGQHLGAVEQHFMLVDQRVNRIEYNRIELHETSPQGLASGYNSTHSTRQDVLRYSYQLEPFIEDGRDWILKDGSSMARARLPEEVVIEMQNWIKCPTSKLLWVEGLPYSPFGPALSLASLHVCKVTVGSGVPCVSYFCKASHSSQRAAPGGLKVAPREAALVSLLYSIIAQLSEKLPDEFEEILGLADRFRLLNGSLESSKAALSLISELILRSPPVTVWVLDGIQLAETGSTMEYIQELITILRDEDNQRVMKVLLTTDGNSLSLAKSMRVTERVDASRMAQNMPGQPMPGGVLPLF